MFIARDAVEPARGDCGVRCEATRAGDPFRMAVSPYWWIDQLWDEHQRHPARPAPAPSTSAPRAGYGMSQSRRAMTECIFGWGKQHGTMRKTKHRGITRVAADFMFNLIAYNLIRIPKLKAA
jgi:hypothetical protein